MQVTRNGETLKIDYGSWKITGHQVHVQWALTFEDRFLTFTIDPVASPEEIVLRRVDRLQGYGHGIYSIDDETLTVCLTNAKNPCPRVFKSDENSDLFLFRRDRE